MTFSRTLTIGIGLLTAIIPASAASVGFAVTAQVLGAPQGNSEASYDSMAFGGEVFGNCSGVGLCFVQGDPTATLATTPQSSAAGLLGYSMTLSAVGSSVLSSGSLGTGLTGISMTSGSGSNGSTETETSASVFMEDGVTLSTAAGGPISFGVDFNLTGTTILPLDSSYDQSVLMSMGQAQMQWDASANDVNGGSSASVIGPATDNWTSYITPVLTPTSISFQGMATVTSGQDVQFSFKQSIDCNLGATCDYFDPGQITLILPQGVTMTSDSGIFLTPTTPEPAGLGLVAGCLALLGLMGRRKRTAAE